MGICSKKKNLRWVWWEIVRDVMGILKNVGLAETPRRVRERTTGAGWD